MNSTHNFLKVTLLFLAAVFTPSGAATSAFAEEITLNADIWCPFNCEPNSALPGIMVEVAQSALKKMGHTVKYTVMPWPRAIEEARTGRIHGIIGALRTDAPDFIFPENPTARSTSDFFVKSDSKWVYEGIKSLETITLGTIKDYTYGDELDEYLNKNRNKSERVQEVVGDEPVEKNVKKLLAGRIGAMVEDKLVLGYYASTHNLTDKIKRAGGVKDEPMYIAFSPLRKDSKALALAISNEVAELQKSGELQKIYAKYVASN